MQSHDVFVSYSHTDAPWVRNILLPTLENHGFSVCIDFRDFQAGSFGVSEMQRAVTESRHTLLVLTESYVLSDWAVFENAMAQSLDPAAVTRKVIPVLHMDCEIPLRIRILHYRDLRQDDPEQWNLLIRDLL